MSFPTAVATGAAGVAAAVLLVTAGPSADAVGDRASRGFLDGAGVATAMTTSAAGARRPKVLLAAGDIACDPRSDVLGSRKACKHRQVARLVKRQVRHGADWWLPLGDLQYETGARAAFRKMYGPAFRGVKKVTRPVAGNHEYYGGGATGYFRFFGHRAGTQRKPWRTFVPRPGWRVVLLDSNCSRVGGCGPTSRQGTWLRRTLDRSQQRCVVAAWHHPLQTSGIYAGDADVEANARPLWQIADAGGVDIVLNGHDHLYERFAKLGGVQEFLVGTGGKSHYYAKQRQPGSRFLLDGVYGVLKLTMKSDQKYAWRFLTTGGGARDRGHGRCTNSPTR